MTPLRRPARTPAPARRAEAWVNSPAPAVELWFQHLLAERMRGLPFLNPALSVQTIDFQRIDGDWLGGLATPWSVQLMLVPGGGSLWVDTSPGERSMVALPVGRLAFIADEGDRGLPAFQYLPLVNATAALAGEPTAISPTISAKHDPIEAKRRVAMIARLPPAPAPQQTPIAPSAIPGSVHRERR